MGVFRLSHAKGSGLRDEDPIQRPGCHAGRGSQFLGRPRAGRQAVGDPKLPGDVNRPRDPGANAHLEQRERIRSQD